MTSAEEKTPSEFSDLEPHVIWECHGMGAGYSAAEGIIKNIDLKITAGERVAILGRPNHGRFLLLRCLAGLRPVREGDFFVFGQKMERLSYWDDWDKIMPQTFRRRMGICLEVEGLLSNVTIREGLELLFRFKYGDHNSKLRDGATKIVAATVQRFHLMDFVDKRPFLLTAAEKRLAGLARAFLSKPHVVILENPSNSIGDLNREQLWKALEHMTNNVERTLVVSTDDWAIAGHFCNRWVVMDEGKIVFDGVPKDFLKTDHELVKNLKNLTHYQSGYQKLLEEVA